MIRLTGLLRTMPPTGAARKQARLPVQSSQRAAVVRADIAGVGKLKDRISRELRQRSLWQVPNSRQSPARYCQGHAYCVWRDHREIDEKDR
jgi:hypothetical protein